MPYDYRPFPYTAPPGLTAPEPRHKVAIVGAGPIGLAMAIELANQAQADAKLAQSKASSVKAQAAADVLQDDIRVLREELDPEGIYLR